MIITYIKKIINKSYYSYLYWKTNKLHNKKYVEKYILDKKYKFIQGSIREYNDYDDSWLLFLSSNAEIVFDVGCNIGQSSLLISYSNTLKKLLLIEPNPMALSIASENLIINNLSENAIFIPKAAYNKSGKKIKLWTLLGENNQAASLDSSFAKTGKNANSYFEVETITLDKIAEKYNYYPDLVKIDVEGVEFSVLEGSINIAKKNKTKFIVEVHSSNTLSIIKNTEQILAWAKQNNYD